jgi:hypothetical protein
MIQLCCSRWAAIAIRPRRSASCRRRDRTVRPDVANAVVPSISEHNSVIPHDANTGRVMQNGCRGKTALPAESSRACPSHSGNDAGSRNAADGVVDSIGEVQLTVSTFCHCVRVSKLRRNRKSAIAAVPSNAGARHRGDRAVRPEATNPMILVVCDPQAAIWCDHHTNGIV